MIGKIVVFSSSLSWVAATYLPCALLHVRQFEFPFGKNCPCLIEAPWEPCNLNSLMGSRVVISCEQNNCGVTLCSLKLFEVGGDFNPFIYQEIKTQESELRQRKREREIGGGQEQGRPGGGFHVALYHSQMTSFYLVSLAPLLSHVLIKPSLACAKRFLYESFNHRMKLRTYMPSYSLYRHRNLESSICLRSPSYAFHHHHCAHSFLCKAPPKNLGYRINVLFYRFRFYSLKMCDCCKIIEKTPKWWEQWETGGFDFELQVFSILQTY